MDIDTGRRRFLELAGAGTAATLAGCNALQGTDDGSGDANADGSATVAVALQADQQELQQRQQQIQSELQDGNISRSEAQQQVSTARTELLGEAASSFEERVGSNDAISIDDSVEQFGVLLVSGSASAIVGTLGYSEVTALLPQATFEQAKSQASQGTATSTPSN